MSQHSHSRDSVNGRKEEKTENKEHHEYQCRALAIPIEIVHAVERDEVSVKEAYLLAIIDGLVRCRGDGCFASDEWLASRVQVKTRQVQNILRSLVSKNLIVVTEMPGKRIIETRWSRRIERVMDENEPVSSYRTPVSSYRTPVSSYQTRGKKLPTDPLYIGSSNKDREEDCPTPASGDQNGVDTRRQKNSAAPKKTEEKNPRLIKHFLEGDGLYGNIKTETKGEELAVLLYKALLVNEVFAVPGTYRDANLTSWGQHFTKLLSIRSYEQIAALIEQHRLHFKDTWWIRLETAKTFCGGIGRLEQAIARELDIASRKKGIGDLPNPPDLPISDEARKIATYAEKAFNWPKGSAAQLPVVMQQSLVNYVELRRRLKYILDRSGVLKLERFATYLLERFGRAHDFLMGWFEGESERYSRWEAWSGVLPPFSIKHKEFRKWVNGLCDDCGYDLSVVEKLFTALEAAK